MLKLNVELFIDILKSNGINIQGGVIHDFIKLCRCEYYDNMYLIIMYYYGIDYFIGGKYNDWCDIFPLEQLDFVIYRNDLYYRQECLNKGD